MQTKLTGHHVEITQALRDYVQDKLGRAERLFDNVTSMHVILSVEKLRHKAEATVHLAGGEVHAESTEEDMYAAIDVLADKVERQILRHKEKLTDHHRADREQVRSYS